jgi:alpha-1,2-mannosyltransferase
MTPAQLLPAPAGGSRAGLAIVVACAILVVLYARVLIVCWSFGDELYDYRIFWMVGGLALAGHPAAAYDWLRPGSQALAGFVYPPVFLLWVTPLALLPYAAGAGGWLGGTLVTFLAGIYTILPRALALLAALAAPVVLFNFETGQNGLLTAGLLAAALALSDSRPIASGVLIGLTAYKPHLGLLLPLFLAVSGRWRVFASATVTVAGLVLVTALVFGADLFVVFARWLPHIGASPAQAIFAHMVQVGDIQSVYGTLRTLGVADAVAWRAHVIIAAAAAAGALWLARTGANPAVEAAGLLTALVVVAPYSELCDLAIVIAACAFLVSDGLARGFDRFEKPALLIVYLLPLIWLIAGLAARASGIHGGAWRTGMEPVACAIVAAVTGCRALRRPAVEARECR